MKEAILSLCSLCVTSDNEHIIIRQVREVPLTYNDVSTEMSCSPCSLLLIPTIGMHIRKDVNMAS
jgi:hypothetical protein